MRNLVSLAPPLQDLKAIKIYSSLNKASERKKLLADIANKGGIVLFLPQNSSLYALEGSKDLTHYFSTLFNKNYLELLANSRGPSPTKKPQLPLKSHYRDLLHQGWKHYDLYLLEAWDINKASPVEERLAYYHAKYQPELNLMRYVSLANGEIEAVYKWNNFKTEAQMLAENQQKTSPKPLLVYQVNEGSPLNKLRAKVWYENKGKTGIYRWVNRITNKSYVGSSLDLGNATNYYFNLQLWTKPLKGNYILIKALKKYGLINFNLEILTYCSAEELSQKELYYLQLLKPQYNPKSPAKEEIITNSVSEPCPVEKEIVPPSPSQVENNLKVSLPPTVIPTSSQSIPPVPSNNFQLAIIQPTSLALLPLPSEDSLVAKNTITTNNSKPIKVKGLPSKGKAWTLSETTRLKQSLARQKREQQPNPGFSVQVYDKITNKTTIYASLSEASLALKINKGTLSRRLNSKLTKPYKNRYLITKG